MDYTTIQSANFNRELEKAQKEYERSVDNINELRKQAEENYIKRVLSLKEMALKKELANNVKTGNMKEEDDDLMLNIKEAAAFLNYTASYLYQLVYKKMIPFHKGNGRKLWFNLGELRKFRCGQWLNDTQQLADEYCRTHAIGGGSKKKN